LKVIAVLMYLQVYEFYDFIVEIAFYLVVLCYCFN